MEPGAKRTLDSTAAPPPKKAALAGIAAGGASNALPPTPISAMTATMLQRQNVNLQGSLSSAKQRAQEAEAQLAAVTANLAARERT